MSKNYTLLLLLFVFIFSAYAKSSLQIVEINPSILDASLSRMDVSPYRYEQTDYLVVQPLINSEAYLKQNGFNVESYLGDGYYIVTTISSKTKTNFESIQYYKTGYISAQQKIDNSLTDINKVEFVSVLFSKSLPANSINSITATHGISMSESDLKYNRFTAYLDKKQINELAKYPFIYYITKGYKEKHTLMYESLQMTGTNQVQENEPFGYGLKGDGIVVGIWDDGAFGEHLDLPINKNFVVDKLYSSSLYMPHPTEVAGCIGGSGNMFQNLKGIAPNVKMVYWDLVGDLINEILDGKLKYNTDISNHSYNFVATNCFQSGLYIPEAADLDKLVYDNPTLLPVVAVGNTATANCAVATDTFSSVDIGFQGCKNAITVGWLFSNEKPVENSGRGPTEDGRLKPELVSKGFSVNALRPNNGFGPVFGSSYSAPQIAGLAALLYQRYKQQFSTLPNASLIKAILFNTARDLGTPGPDYINGFGKPDAFRAVKSVSDNLFFENSVVQNEIKTHVFNSAANTAQLKVTLSWTDKEGSPIAAKALVNNLDLKLVTPNGDTILPWKLKPESPKTIALRGIDNINTNEQITIDNPLTGNYTIVVKGSSVPYGPQNYAVAFFTQERKIEISHPNGGEVLDAGGNTIRWNANGIDSIAKIEFSSDNGSNWQTVVSNQQLSTKSLAWNVPTIFSQQCLIKITSGNNVDVSASNFTIGAQLNYNLINAVVCDRTAKISWSAFSGATAYRVYLFIDTIWVMVGETTQTELTVNNLINGKKYPYSVSTIINGFEGNRSLAKFLTPGVAACTSTNDVGVYAVNRPIGGRKFTSLALTTTEKLSFIIKNFGTVTQNSISVSYRINGGPVRTATLTDVVSSNDTSIINFNTNENLSAAGNYSVIAWTNLASDVNKNNDTLYYTIKHLPNNALTLPFEESFENLNTQQTYSAFGLNGAEYIDYYPETGGMLRSNEGNLYAKTGQRGVTLDNYLGSGNKKNELIFTYNLSNYVDSIIFLEFSYMNRNEPDSNDILFARGDDTKPWIPIYDLFKNRGTIGSYKTVSEINLRQKLKIENGQNLSSSVQLKIQHSGSKTGTTPYGDGGYTFDDFKLLVAGKDIAVANATIKKAQCTNSFVAQPISFTIRNNSTQSITNLPVTYKIDDNPAVTEIVNSTIAASDTLRYTFNNLFNTGNSGLYSIRVWATNAGDKYPFNDTAYTTTVVMATVDSFPYYNDFETNNGTIFSEGTNNSWVWTTPHKYNIDNAAQDNKAWTTGADKGYNFNERSYLYMGCLDFSSLTTDPYIAFNFLSVMQTQSDSAFAEYSTNGTDWTRLGCYNCGLNWYNGFQGKPYWDRIIFPWQVAHMKIPLSILQNPSNFMYRIALISDNFITFEGLAIDDLRIFNDYSEIATTDSVYVAEISNGNGWMQFYRNGRLVTELFDDNKALGNVILGYEANSTKQKVLDNKNIFPRNWVFKPQNPQVGNYKVRLYVQNTEYTDYIIEEDSINRMGDIGLLRYIGLNTNLDIIDNHVNSYYKYYTPQQIQFYPYQNGYYIEFETDTLGEFYLLSTKQDADAIQNINLFDFSAQKVNDDVLLDWKTSKEVNSKEFIIQYSFDAATFIDIDTVPAGGFSSIITPYNYLHELNAISGVYYYRIKMVDNTNKFTFSLIDSVYFAPSVGIKQNSFTANAYVAENDIVVEFKNKQQLLSTVFVYNTLGQLQFTRKLILQNGINPLGISNFSDWSRAAYYLHIRSDDKSYYTKLLKQ